MSYGPWFDESQKTVEDEFSQEAAEELQDLVKMWNDRGVPAATAATLLAQLLYEITALILGRDEAIALLGPVGELADGATHEGGMLH